MLEISDCTREGIVSVYLSAFSHFISHSLTYTVSLSINIHNHNMLLVNSDMGPFSKLPSLLNDISFENVLTFFLFFSAHVHCEAPQSEWSGDEEKAGGTHRGPTPGPWTAPTQHLLSLLVRLLQVSMVKKTKQTQ